MHNFGMLKRNFLKVAEGFAV